MSSYREINRLATDKIPDLAKNEKDVSYYLEEISKRLESAREKCEIKNEECVILNEKFETQKEECSIQNEEFVIHDEACEIQNEEFEDLPVVDAFDGVFVEFSKIPENNKTASIFEDDNDVCDVTPSNEDKNNKQNPPQVEEIRPISEQKKLTHERPREKVSRNENSTLFDDIDLLEENPLEEEDLNFVKEEKIVKTFPIASKENTDNKQRVRVVKLEKQPEIQAKPIKRSKKYQLPSLDLLNEGNKVVSTNESGVNEEARINSEKLVSTLRNFGIGVTVTGVTRGPTVTRFEFKPDEGIKISRIVSLTDDLALSLAASAVRMEAPIPGKPAIGIEIPNKKAEIVYIKDVLSSKEYGEAKSKLAVAMGKDIDGRTVICDVARMPHLLIAGSTGSGKSVCINTMIMGILYKAAPSEVKFIMIDPKVVELGIYNNIPHLLIPVVTEPKKASAALAWAVQEVERRYRLFADNNVRDLASFNKLIDEKPELQGESKIPQIVIIIDELADLMMVCSQDVEKSIIRLAQKARAAGVHLVIATQRPSVDVITGIIKANIPSRIAFAVASQFDSRTILDTNGAEKLLGRGDMLYHPLGCTKSSRLQCAFVSDEEVEHVVEFIRDNNGVPEFDEEVTSAIDQAVQASQKDKGKDSEPVDNDDTDKDMDYIMEAAEIAFQQGALSTSSIQRRLRLGYSRAARIVDSLEEMGLLSQSDGSKPRTVLMTKEEWEKALNDK